MFRYRSKLVSLASLILMSILGASCSNPDEKRPSPLASDSTVIDGTTIVVNYSSPGVKKREIWGELVPYGEIWRTGANEASYLATSSDILIEGQKVEAGKYAIFTIPTDTTWTIILNSEWDQWGAYNYDPEKDVVRFTVDPKRSDYTERMTFSFVDESLQFEWENLYYRLDIEPL